MADADELSDDGRTLTDEAGGQEFLNTDISTITFTHAVKTTVNNVLGHFGGNKPSQRSEAHKDMLVGQLLNMIPFASKLTGNSEHCVACCVDADTIRNYDLKEKGYVLPPYHVGANRGNTLHTQLVNLVGESYAKMLKKDEADYRAANPNGRYMERTSWENALEGMLGEITRYCIKYWHLHPHLSRLEACTNSVDHLIANFKRRGDCKRMIDELILERQRDDLTDDVLALDTEEATYDEEVKTVFKENESAQTVITNFLKVHGWKWNQKEVLDVLEALKVFINEALEDEEKPRFHKFMAMVPKRTAAYKDKLAKQQKQKDAQEERKRKQEEKQEAEKQAKKKKVLELFGDPTEEGASLLTGGEDAGSGTDVAKQILEDDEYAEYKFPIKEFSIVKLAAPKKGTRKSGRQEAREDFAGIVKYLVRLTTDGKLTVTYQEPGVIWKKMIHARIGNVLSALTHFSSEHPTLVEECMPVSPGGQFDHKQNRVVLAIMLQAAAQNEQQLTKICLPPYFDEKTFGSDLVNTSTVWLSPIFTHAGDLFQCLYDLLHAATRMAGLKLEERRQHFIDFLKVPVHMTEAKSKQVLQICEMLDAIREWLDFKTGFENRNEVCDPFNTVNGLFWDDVAPKNPAAS